MSEIAEPAGMRRDTVVLTAADGTTTHELAFLRFGTPGARPKAYLQAGLHADELPGLLVLRKMTEALHRLDAEGKITGEIVLCPVANPIGLSQVEGGYMRGRVEAGSGRNFNRGYPDLFDDLKAKVDGQLGDDGEQNVATIRKAINELVGGMVRPDAFRHMQLSLYAEAADADYALDIHADNEALLHLYVGEANWPDAHDLAAELDARAILLTKQSGGNPFDEACGHHWVQLAEAFPDTPIPRGCLSSTVELRSNNHVTEKDSEQDLRALLRFLTRRGVIDGHAGGLPRLLAEAAPAEAMQQLRSPAEGVVVYRRALGDTVRAGEVIADIVPPFGDAVSVTAETDGLLFARHDQTWAWPDKVIGKVAGREALASRNGHLLTD